jgi:hypothetical protein
MSSVQVLAVAGLGVIFLRILTDNIESFKLPYNNDVIIHIISMDRLASLEKTLIAKYHYFHSGTATKLLLLLAPSVALVSALPTLLLLVVTTSF